MVYYGLQVLFQGLELKKPKINANNVQWNTSRLYVYLSQLLVQQSVHTPPPGCHLPALSTPSQPSLLAASPPGTWHSLLWCQWRERGELHPPSSFESSYVQTLRIVNCIPEKNSLTLTLKQYKQYYMYIQFVGYHTIHGSLQFPPSMQLISYMQKSPY